MPSRMKELMVEELKSRYAPAENLFFIDYRGLDAQEAYELRKELRSQGISLTVVKNSLAVRALSETGKSQAERFLDGPTAIMTGGDPVAVARAAVASGKKHKVIEVRGGLIEGKVLGAREVTDLSRLPSRPEMLGIVVSAMTGTGAKLVSAILAPAGRLAGAIEAKTKEPEG